MTCGMTFLLLLLLLFGVVISFVNIAEERNVPEVYSIKVSDGEPLPTPQSMNSSTQRLGVHPSSFHFVSNETREPCDLLFNAFNRY
jgi:hypothetical protein